MVGHKICLYGERWLIIPKLSLLLLFIWSSALVLKEIHILPKKFFFVMLVSVLKNLKYFLLEVKTLGLELLILTVFDMQC